jgi:alpha-ketoglutarate-dependent taurine dioxygenase
MKTTMKTSLKKLPSIKRNPVSVSEDAMVSAHPLIEGKNLPMQLKPAIEGADLKEWACRHREFIETTLLQHGGILFRDFAVHTQQAFEEYVSLASAQLLHYTEGATPRTAVSDKVYTSTEYPPDQSIALHNELSYVTTWPMRIWFFCLIPASQGGETPIADMRRVYQRIPAAIRERFAAKRWMLVRNYGRHLSLSWQTAFRTIERSTVEEYCRTHQIAFEWRGPDHLRTSQVRPAIARHPQTKEFLWFNHIAFWHVSSLEPGTREALLQLYPPEDLPYHTYYGDGSPIEEAVIEEINHAYQRETVKFVWQEGDVLMLDNMLVSHGRSPYRGPRRILTAMGDPCSQRGVIDAEL